MHEYVKLARETVEEYARHGRRKRLKTFSPLFQKKAGVFVSIKKNGSLRGCIGTIEPTEENLAEEIISNAISAAFRDPRFPPVQAEELDKLEFSVDILGEPEIVESLQELDPQKYGIIVARGQQRGLLLPALEGVDTVEEQLAIARRKAGLLPGQEEEIYRFKVERYK